MTKLQALQKRMHEIATELEKIVQTKKQLDFKSGQLQEQMWRLQGMIEEESDENEYNHF